MSNDPEDDFEDTEFSDTEFGLDDLNDFNDLDSPTDSDEYEMNPPDSAED